MLTSDKCCFGVFFRNDPYFSSVAVSRVVLLWKYGVTRTERNESKDVR